MSVLRHIAILAFMGLITGCSDVECPGPGYPSFPDCPTNFLLRVVDADPNTGEVEVVYPEDLPEDRLPGIKDRKEDSEFKKRLHPYTIYVRDLKTLIDSGRLVKGKEYVFHNGNGSPFFEVFPENHELFSWKDGRSK